MTLAVAGFDKKGSYIAADRRIMVGQDYVDNTHKLFCHYGQWAWSGELKHVLKFKKNLMKGVSNDINSLVDFKDALSIGCKGIPKSASFELLCLANPREIYVASGADGECFSFHRTEENQYPFFAIGCGADYAKAYLTIKADDIKSGAGFLSRLFAFVASIDLHVSHTYDVYHRA